MGKGRECAISTNKVVVIHVVKRNLVYPSTLQHSVEMDPQCLSLSLFLSLVLSCAVVQLYEVW